MLRRSLVTACALVLLAGCQDYNFNPVGKCVIQPGSSRIRIANLSTADILFVVDDSGSMEPAQQNLSRNFDAFISALATTQADRISKGLDALDFHVAITTSSVFENNQAASCVLQQGQLSCSVPANAYHAQYSYACSAANQVCGDYSTIYHSGSAACTRGVSSDKAPYPAGDFVSRNAHPKVTHFTKTLKWETWGTPSVDPALTQLVNEFKDNVEVGSCGSGQEQHFEAARLALRKALQLDGLKQPPDVLPADWPHPGAKLVVVWVGNEDDCSNPSPNSSDVGVNAAGTLVLSGTPGNDSCIANAGGKLTPVADYASFLTGLGRPVAAAFIYSATNCQVVDGNTVCTPGACNPGPGGGAPVTCGGPPFGSCLGQSPGTRFHDLAAALQARDVSTVEGSVCDANFGSTLQQIAELVKPPAGLTLPSQPAASEVAVLRIESADAASSRQCRGPALSSADTAQSDWWFIAPGPSGKCDAANTEPSASPTSCIFINHTTGRCEPNPGETYIAQYLGLVPAGGCTRAAGEPETQSAFCANAIDGPTGDPKNWRCTVASGQTIGTCTCNPGT